MTDIKRLIEDIAILKLYRVLEILPELRSYALEKQFVTHEQAFMVNESISILTNEVREYSKYDNLVRDLNTASKMDLRLTATTITMLTELIDELSIDIRQEIVDTLSAVKPVLHGVVLGNLVDTIRLLAEKIGDATPEYLVTVGLTENMNELKHYLNVYNDVGLVIYSQLLSQLNACIDIRELGGPTADSVGLRMATTTINNAHDAVTNILSSGKRQSQDIKKAILNSQDCHYKAGMFIDDDYHIIIDDKLSEASKTSELVRSKVEVLTTTIQYVSEFFNSDMPVKYANPTYSLLWVKTRLDILSDIITDLGNSINDNIDKIKAENGISIPSNIPEDRNGE